MKIGIELECLIPLTVYRELMQKVNLGGVQYRAYAPVGDYWTAHSDASINNISRLPCVLSKQVAIYGKMLQHIYDQYHDQTWQSVEFSTIALLTPEIMNATVSDTVSDNNPIRKHELKLALESLANILQITDKTAPLHNKLQINHSCGLHLHISNDADFRPLRSQSLFAAKQGYLKWLKQNRGYDHVKLFSAFYHRGSYSPKVDKILSYERREFALNLGIEWRGFHALGSETFNDLCERITAGIECFAEAYSNAANSPRSQQVKLVVPATFKISGFAIRKATYYMTPLFTDDMELPCAI
jgi:hypothetical protein